MTGDRFERRCRTHPRREVVEVEHYRGGRGLGVVCEAGHPVSLWLVFDTETKKVVGAGSLLGGLLLVPVIPGRTLEPGLCQSDGPGRPCKHGHLGRWRRRADANRTDGIAWVCRDCQIAARQKQNHRRAVRRAGA